MPSARSPSCSAWTDLPETVGPYRVIRRVAVGGMGEVFLGHDDGLDRPVAIKRVRPGTHLDPDRRERFRREARAIARLDHPAIVRVYDLCHDEVLESLVMEFVDGTTLYDLLRDGPMPIRFAIALAVQVTDGLALAHDHGIVHRDLKSENVLVTPTGRAKITDFGIAKRLLADDEALTKPEVLLGTCRAMAPEQALGLGVDHRADLFSLGVMLYEMVTGVSPFETKNDLLTLKRVTTEWHQPAREVNPQLSARLSKLIDELLEKEPELRPENAEVVVARLIRIALDMNLDLGKEGLASYVRGRLGPSGTLEAMGERLLAAAAAVGSRVRRLWPIGELPEPEATVTGSATRDA